MKSHIQCTHYKGSEHNNTAVFEGITGITVFYKMHINNSKVLDFNYHLRLKQSHSYQNWLLWTRTRNGWYHYIIVALTWRWLDIQGDFEVQSESTDTCTKLKTTVAILSVADETIQLRVKGEEQEIGTSLQTYKNSSKSLFFKGQAINEANKNSTESWDTITHVNENGKILPLFPCFWYLTEGCCKKKDFSYMLLLAIDQLFICLNSDETNQKIGPIKGTRKLGGFQQRMIEIIIKLGYLRNQLKDIDVRIMLK